MSRHIAQSPRWVAGMRPRDVLGAMAQRAQLEEHCWNAGGSFNGEVARAAIIATKERSWRFCEGDCIECVLYLIHRAAIVVEFNVFRRLGSFDVMSRVELRRYWRGSGDGAPSGRCPHLRGRKGH